MTSVSPSPTLKGVIPGIILTEIAALWLLSRFVVQSIFTFLTMIFPSRSVAVPITTAILYPGTIIHELAHLLSAGILGVRAGKMELIPEHIQSEEVRTGSVMIQATDPVRRSLIGLAPLFAGFVAVTAISWFLSQSVREVFILVDAHVPVGEIIRFPGFYVALGCLYLVFAVSNTMFPSRVDLKGTPWVLAVLLILITAAYYIGFRVALTGSVLDAALAVRDALVQSLTLVLAVNVVVLLLVRLNIHLMTKMLGIRLVRK